MGGSPAYITPHQPEQGCARQTAPGVQAHRRGGERQHAIFEHLKREDASVRSFRLSPVSQRRRPRCTARVIRFEKKTRPFGLKQEIKIETRITFPNDGEQCMVRFIHTQTTRTNISRVYKVERSMNGQACALVHRRGRPEGGPCSLGLPNINGDNNSTINKK